MTDLTEWAALKKRHHQTQFQAAFAEARRRGLHEFTWRGNRYHTQRADRFPIETEKPHD